MGIEEIMERISEIQQTIDSASVSYPYIPTYKGRVRRPSWINFFTWRETPRWFNYEYGIRFQVEMRYLPDGGDTAAVKAVYAAVSAIPEKFAADVTLGGLVNVVTPRGLDPTLELWTHSDFDYVSGAFMLDGALRRAV